MEDIDRITSLRSNTRTRDEAQQAGMIKKYTSLIDFSRLNYLWSYVVIQSDSKELLADYLMKHPNVNNLYRLHDGALYAETVFPTMSKFHAFLESLQDYDLISIEEYYVIQALGQEMMLSEPTG
jgi:hypothetical protein